jgi:hypothetical protein
MCQAAGLLERSCKVGVMVTSYLLGKVVTYFRLR